MDIFDSRYYRRNKQLLSTAGVWPFQTSIEKKIMLITSIVGAAGFAIPQGLYFVIHDINVDNVISGVPSIAGSLIIISKLFTMAHHSDKFKALLEQIREDWNGLRSGTEIAIMAKYAENSRRFTMVYSTLAILTVLCYTLMPFVAPIMDITSPLNETRPRHLINQSEYLVDREKYYYILLLGGQIFYVICVPIVVGSDTLYIAILEHTCGMFYILRYRLERIYGDSDHDLVREKCSRLSEEATYSSVVDCVQLHKRILRFSNISASAFTTFLFFDIGLGILAHSTACVMMVLCIDRPSQFGIYAAIAGAQSCRLFFNNFPGQRLMNHSADVINAAYSSEWPEMSTRIMKLLLFFIMASQTPCTITVAKIYIISMDSFGTIMKTSLSYCTLMASLHDN